MKRLSYIVIALVVAVTLGLSGCTSAHVDRCKELKEIAKATYNNITDTFTEETCSYSLVSDYLKSWAASSNVDVAKLGKHYTVLRNKATDGCSKVKKTTLQVSVNTDDIQSDTKVFAVALAELMGPDEHGDIILIVLEEKGANLIGARQIDKKYLKCDNFINIQNSSKTLLYEKGSLDASETLYTKAGTGKPDYENAYEIIMTMPEYSDPYAFEKKNNYPNPINTIGSLLANAKSAGKLFEIASFTSESNEGCTPYSAKAIVVIDPNHVEAFKNKFDKSFASMENKFDKLETSFVYTMNQLDDTPKSVLSNKSADNLISLMYTLNTGISEQDENTGIIQSASYIKEISTGNGDITIRMGERARTKEAMTNLRDVTSVTTGLCDFKLKSGKVRKTWSTDTKARLYDYFIGRVPLPDNESPIMLKSNECEILYAKCPEMNMISYYCNMDDRYELMEDITHYLIGLTE